MSGRRDIFHIVQHGTVDEFEAVHSRGVGYAAANSEGANSLHIAAQCGRIEFIKHLLRVAPQLLESKDSRGATPLLKAVQSNQTHAAVLLVQNGADFSARSAGGVTPLSRAKEHNPELYKLLLDNYQPSAHTKQQLHQPSGGPDDDIKYSDRAVKWGDKTIYVQTDGYGTHAGTQPAASRPTASSVFGIDPTAPPAAATTTRSRSPTPSAALSVPPRSRSPTPSVAVPPRSRSPTPSASVPSRSPPSPAYQTLLSRSPPPTAYHTLLSRSPPAPHSAGLPLTSPVGQLPLSSPVGQLPLSSPVGQLPLSSPVGQLPTATATSEAASSGGERFDFECIDAMLSPLLQLCAAHIEFARAVVDVNAVDNVSLRDSLQQFVRKVQSFTQAAQTAQLTHDVDSIRRFPSRVKSEVEQLLAGHQQGVGFQVRPGLSFRESPLFDAAVRIGGGVEEMFVALQPRVTKARYLDVSNDCLLLIRSVLLGAETLTSAQLQPELLTKFVWLLHCAHAVFRQSDAVFPQSAASVEHFFRLHLYVHHFLRSVSRLATAQHSARHAVADELSSCRDAANALAAALSAASNWMSTAHEPLDDAKIAALLQLASTSLCTHLAAVRALPDLDGSYVKLVPAIASQIERLAALYARLDDCIKAHLTVSSALLDSLAAIIACVEVYFRLLNAITNNPVLSPRPVLNNLLLLCITKAQHLTIQVAVFGTKRALQLSHGPPATLVGSLLGVTSLICSSLLVLTMICQPIPAS